MIAREVAERLTVGEVMLSRPKTLDVDATLGDLRRLFENRSVRTALLVDGGRFAGTVERADVPPDAADGEPLRTFVRFDAELVRPDVPVRDVIAQLDASREGRLVVVDEDGATLRGLLCLSGIDDAFCSGGSSEADEPAAAETSAP
jgi:CBS domain-containing protein